MEIVTVIPIARGIFKDELTYFTTQKVNCGTLVSIPIKNRIIGALVTEVRPATEIKAALRHADFPLKKILQIKQAYLFSPQFLLAAARAAEYFVCPLGQILKNLVPAEILKLDSGEITLPTKLSIADTFDSSNSNVEKYALQEPDEQRLVYYKGIVREEFSKNGSVLLCLPSITEIGKTFALLEKGIGQYTIVFHHALGRSGLLAAWQRALNTPHPILIITTPSNLSLPRGDLKTIIIDRENSPAYKTLNRPFLDYRIIAEMFAETAGLKLILGDVVLRTETIYRLEQGIFQPQTPPKHHAFSSAEQQIVNLKKSGESFPTLSEELVEALKNAHEQNERFFLFVHRRGLEPLVLCQDCGRVVTCRNCEVPVGLHESRAKIGAPTENVLVCRHCGNRRSAAEKCQTCDSWRLVGLGIGIDLVAKELTARLNPNDSPKSSVKIFKLDSDEAKSAKRATTIVKKFLETPGGILLGTEMAMFYLKEKIENAAVVAIDSMFALPDYQINERVFNLLIRLRALASKRFIIQNRDVKNRLFDYASRGALIEFHRQELADRREYGYPPFRLFIKISLTGPKNEVLSEMRMLENKLGDYDFDVFPAFSAVTDTRYQLNLLLRLANEDWPKPKLSSILKSLSPKFTININPNSLVN